MEHFMLYLNVAFLSNVERRNKFSDDRVITRMNKFVQLHTDQLKLGEDMDEISSPIEAGKFDFPLIF